MFDRFFAMLRKASSTLRAPKSASALLRDGIPREAISTGALGFTEENFTCATTFLRRSASSVKFCAIWTAPVKSAIAINRFGPALAAMNFAAASRARAWSVMSMVELSKNSTR